MDKKLTKENIVDLVSKVRYENCPLNPYFINDVYDVAFESIANLEAQNVMAFGQPINSMSLVHYIIGEYIYATKNKNEEQRKTFDRSDRIRLEMATVVADKYMATEVLEFRNEAFSNKYLPPISSLDTYVNFMLNLLSKLPKNKPEQTLIIDLLYKSVSSIRCILKLLCEGYETEAMATWRTLHESECILMVIAKYGDPIIKSYIKHMSYGIVFHGSLDDKEATDATFVLLKKEMKEHNLKSKDMKKFIEYGWLYATKEAQEMEDFRLNFRDGLQKVAGLKSYSSIYETSSEIVHSTPMLIYSNNAYYYLLTLLNVYESFFRIEKIFADYCFTGQFENIYNQYQNVKSVYFKQLNVIYKNELLEMQRISKS